MEYERFTAKELRDTDIVRVLDENGNVIVDRRLFERFIEQHNRLAELEDKIAQGTLIELPCKVGDTIYWISSNNRDIFEVVVNRIALAEHDRTILYVEEKGFGEYTIMFVDDIYLTREEAEAKLKELQE